MGIKDILLVLQPGFGEDRLTQTAAALAGRCGAQLSALYVRPDFPLMAVAAPGLPISAEVYRAYQAQDEADCADSHRRFEDLLARHDLLGEWRQVQGDASHAVALEARFHDLAVIGQRDPAGRPGRAFAVPPEAVIAGSGRPALVVPHAGRFTVVGRHVLVAWNASAEASRALHDALPLLAMADRVTLAIADAAQIPHRLGDCPGPDIARHLARHGIEARIERLSPGAFGLDDLLLCFAADIGADLMVAGCYGHSQLHEFLVGGTTRGMLRHLTLPVLMAH